MWTALRPGADFDGLSVGIGELDGPLLGMAEGRRVVIDATAAGWGWTVSGGRMDLLAAVVHELGHVLGLDHASGNGIMAPTLAPVPAVTGVDRVTVGPSAAGFSGTTASARAVPPAAAVAGPALLAGATVLPPAPGRPLEGRTGGHVAGATARLVPGAVDVLPRARGDAAPVAAAAAAAPPARARAGDGRQGGPAHRTAAPWLWWMLLMALAAAGARSAGGRPVGRPRGPAADPVAT